MISSCHSIPSNEERGCYGLGSKREVHKVSGHQTDLEGDTVLKAEMVSLNPR